MAMMIMFLLLLIIKQVKSITTVFIEPWETYSCYYIYPDSESLCDSIMISLETATYEGITDLQLILLQDSSNIDHYLLETEPYYYNYSYLGIINDGESSFSIEDNYGTHQVFEYSLNQYLQFYFNTLIIKPWLCSDRSLNISIIPPEYQCINDDQYVRVYLKISVLAINIAQTLIIQNIIFDGSENIFFLNNMNILKSDPYYINVSLQ